MSWSVIRGADLRPTPWRNGLGMTRDVVTRLGPDGGFLWQVSIADLVQDSAFSHFPQCDRVFTPIVGTPPPELSFEGGPFAPCPLLVPRRFSGEWVTECRVASIGRAFNVIFDRRRHAVDVDVLQVGVGETVPLLDVVESVIYCLAGSLRTADLVLREGDSLVGTGPVAEATRDGAVIRVGIRAR